MANNTADKQIADLMVELYAGNRAAFDFYEPGVPPIGICWAVKRVAMFGEVEADLILLRGSKTPVDWALDFMAAPAPSRDSETLGPVHPGFALGMADCWKAIKSRSSGPWILTGHSLGAGRAAILTGIMLEDGVKPLKRVVFGEPKPGFAKLAQYISSVPAVSYRNCQGTSHDIVTDVPISFSQNGYVHSVPLTDVFGAPDPSSKGMFRLHHMQLYAKALSQ